MVTVTVETAKAEHGKKAAQREMRRQAMLDAADALFLEKGYGATSLTDIVKRSGGSLATLYELFGGKEGLFRAMVEQGCVEFFGFLRDGDLDGSPREKLREVARRFLMGVLADDGAFLRVVVSEAGQFPEVGEAFYSAGPANATTIIGDYLASETCRGTLHVEDVGTAARMFISMLLYDIQMRLLCGVPVKLTRRQLDRHIDQVVDAFMKLYVISRRAKASRKKISPKKKRA